MDNLIKKFADLMGMQPMQSNMFKVIIEWHNDLPEQGELAINSYIMGHFNYAPTSGEMIDDMLDLTEPEWSEEDANNIVSELGRMGVQAVVKPVDHNNEEVKHDLEEDIGQDAKDLIILQRRHRNREDCGFGQGRGGMGRGNNKNQNECNRSGPGMGQGLGQGKGMGRDQDADDLLQRRRDMNDTAQSADDTDDMNNIPKGAKEVFVTEEVTTDQDGKEHKKTTINYKL